MRVVNAIELLGETLGIACGNSNLPLSHRQRGTKVVEVFNDNPIRFVEIQLESNGILVEENADASNNAN